VSVRVRGGSVLAACLLAVAALSCRAAPEGITVEVLVDEEAFRPDHLMVWWTSPDGRARKDIRIPATGALPRDGRVLGSLSVEIKDAAAGDRNMIAWGIRGTERVSAAVARVPWAPGERKSVTLTLGCLSDLDAKGLLPDEAPGTPPRSACGRELNRPLDDAGIADEATANGSSVTPLDAAPTDVAPEALPPDAPSTTDRLPGSDDARADKAPDVRRDASVREPLPNGTDLGRGLALYLKFDDLTGGVIVRDSSGNRNMATLANLDPFSARVEGRAGTALDFGGRGWVAVESSSSLNSLIEGFSISAFVNRAGDGTIVARRAVGPGGYLYRLQIAGAKLAGVINSANGARAELTSTVAVPSRDWVHLAMVYDRVTVRLYLDGNNVGQQKYGLNIGPENSPLLVGASEDATAAGAGDLFTGELDEVAVYGRALSEAEVRALAAGHQPPDR